MTARPDHRLDLVARAAPVRATAHRLAPEVGTADSAADLLADAPSVDVRTDALIPMAPRRRRTRRVVVGLVAASVLGIVAGGVSVVLPADTPGAPTSSFAAEVEKLALRAEATPADSVRPDQFRHVINMSNQTVTNLTGNLDTDGDSWLRTEHWYLPDGTSYSRREESGGFTPTIWHPERNLKEFPPSSNNPTPAFIDSAPTDPAALIEFVRADQVRQMGRDPQDPKLDQLVFFAVQDMLTPYAKPEFRAGALRALQLLGDGTVEHDVVLPSGRTGTGLRFTYGTDSTSVIVFDPDTAAVLGGAGAYIAQGSGPDGPWSQRSESAGERLVDEVVDSVPQYILDGD